jgi:hypothetical protein
MMRVIKGYLFVVPARQKALYFPSNRSSSACNTYKKTGVNGLKGVFGRVTHVQ